MKISMISLAIFFLIGCASNSSTETKGNSTNSSDNNLSDTLKASKQPTGMDNSSVISTDTSAMKVKADSAKHKK